MSSRTDLLKDAPRQESAFPVPRGGLGTSGDSRLRRLARHLLGLSRTSRLGILGALGIVLVYSAAAWFIEAQVTQVVLDEISKRALDQVQFGVLSRVFAEDLQPPHDTAKLDRIGARLDPLLARARQGDSGVIRFILYAQDGTIVYSDLARLRGQAISPLSRPALAQALGGVASAEVTPLLGPENSDLRERYGSALEAYAPLVMGARVLGAYEFYGDAAPLQRIRSLVWGVVAGGLGIVFVLLLVALDQQEQHQRRPSAASERSPTTMTGEVPLQFVRMEDEPSGTAGVEALRVVVAQSDILVRNLLSTLFASQPDVQLVATAADSLRAVESARAYRPDVVLMDADLPGLDSTVTAARVKLVSPVTKVVVLTAKESPAPGTTGVVDGYVPKILPLDELVAMIRGVARGERPLPDPNRWPELDTPAGRNRDYGLTPREMDVLRLLAADLTYRQIAARLVVSEETVRSHVKSILHKLGQPDRVRAVEHAASAGLL